MQQIICGNLTGLAKTYELHVLFRCLSAICCGLMYNAGGVICKKFISVGEVKEEKPLFFSRGYHKWKIQDHGDLSVRAVLVGWDHVAPSSGELLVELDQSLHVHFLPDHSAYFLVPLDSKLAPLAY